MGSQEIAFVPFAISSLKSGLNDFTFLIVQNPDNQNLSSKYRMSTTGSNVLSLRGTVNNGSEKNRRSPKYVKLNKAMRDQKLSGILLTKEKNLNPWLTQTVFNDNRIIDFNINIGNMDDENKPFALISFIDWNQASINNTVDIFWGDIYPESSDTVKGEINIVDIKENSISNYTTIFIPYPFHHVDPLDPSFMIESSARVGLDNRSNY